MDRMIYTAMTGAKQILEQQATVAHNLANAATNGFRAQVDSFRAVPIIGEGLATRAFVVDATVGTDFSSGPIQRTGRDLDVAVKGNGFIAVQRQDGSEAYTRNGAFRISEAGILQTQSGQTVLGDSGPITIPVNTIVGIAADGTVSGIPTEGKASVVNTLGRIKLVNPPTRDLARGGDGLFNLPAGAQADVDAAVRLESGSIESSNVNVVDAMVDMITLARQFETQMKLLQNAESNAAKASQFMSLNA